MTTVSPSSSVQQARHQLGLRLREIRLDAGLTGPVLAKAAGWHQSKVSRIENARTSPSANDIRAWCRICEAEEQANDLVAALRAAEGSYIEWRHLQRTGLRRLQESYVPIYERAKLLRFYCSQVIPGLLQTPGYAGALLSAIHNFRGTRDDVTDAVAARVARQKVLLEPDHRFEFVIEEAALRYRLGDAEVMAGQLGYLLAVISLPTTRIGIVPFTVDARPIWTVENFSIHDDDHVQVELVSAQVNITAPGEVAQYVKAFEHLSELAVTGGAARTLITAAIDVL